MSSVPTVPHAELVRLRWQSLIVGIVALVPCIIGGFLSPAPFFRAYLTAYLFYLGLPLGCMAILMLYHLTGGAWGFLIRRLLEAGMRTLPLLAVLFVPIACGLGFLYVWARPDQVALSANLQHKQGYLNAPFFWGRAALYFILWLLLAYYLNRWSRQQDETGDARLAKKLTGLSGPGLVIYGLTITFASVDWAMSIQPTYRSTIFGPLFASGQIVSAQAFVLVVLAFLLTRTSLASQISLAALNDLANLLLTFLVIWAYLTWFQFMLAWMANLPYEVVWYLDRSSHGWQWVAWALFIFHFAVPFFLLLMRGVKRNAAELAKVAGIILFMQLVYMYYQVMPGYADTQLWEHWMDFLTPIGVGGIWLAFFLWQLGRSPLLPRHDLSQESASHLQHLDQEKAAREEEAHHG